MIKLISKSLKFLWYYGEQMEEIFGKFEFDGKVYPFACKDYVVTIVSAGYEYAEYLHEKECDDIIFGVSSENNPIIFFGCKFHNNGFFKIATKILVQGFVLLNEHVKPKAENLFHQIAFYSPAISDFYPPQLAIKPNNGNSGKFDLSIKLRESNETTRRIDISECQMILGFYYLNKLKQQNSDLLHAIPYITFEFKNAIGIEKLKEYYLRLYNFLVFMNFNKSVPIEKIKLYVKKENNIREIGNAYINSKYNNFESKQHKAIYAQALTNKEISDLFIQVSDNNDIKKHYYIPDNKKDIHRFNHSDLLLCATCFEGIFKQNYPNFKANEKETFAKVKNDFLQFANDYRDTKELTKSEKKYADKLYDQIYHYDGRLEEIFNFALKEYRFVISDALTRCKSVFKIRDNENLGSIYADIRNHFAHGTFFVLGDKECFVYAILQILIYTIN